MKNLEQIRARNALKCQSEHGSEIIGEEGGMVIKKLPQLIMNHGLLATAAFAFGVDIRHANGIFNNGVFGVQAQPALTVVGLYVLTTQQRGAARGVCVRVLGARYNLRSEGAFSTGLGQQHRFHRTKGVCGGGGVCGLRADD